MHEAKGTVTTCKSRFGTSCLLLSSAPVYLRDLYIAGAPDHSKISHLSKGRSTQLVEGQQIVSVLQQTESLLNYLSVSGFQVRKTTFDDMNLNLPSC